MWEAIAYVSSGFTLAAFVAAVSAWIIKGKSEEKQKLISVAADENRAKLVQDALEFFHVETKELTKDQKFNLAIQQIQARANRFRTIALLIGFLAITAAVLSAYAIKELYNYDKFVPKIIQKPTPIYNHKKTVDNLQKSFVTRLTVWSEIDADIYVDGTKTIRIDHSSGFDYSGAKTRISPKSEMTLKTPRFEKTVSLWSMCDENSEDCRLRVGTQSFSDIQITEEEKRIAMGDSSDIPKLLKELLQGVKYPVRYWAAERLGYIGDKSAIDGLLKALRDPEPYVQAIAAEALARIGEPSVLPIIENAYEEYNKKESYGYIFEAAIRDLKFIEKQKRN